VVEPTAKDQRIIDGLRLVEDQQKRALKDKDETIARLAIRNEKLARHLEATELDKRTMLPNYEVVSSMLANAIHQEKRGDGFAVVFMDAFRFKLYNEHWSYALGNIVLLNLGQILRHELRDAFIGRWGGEEFVGILYSLRDEKSAAVALWRLMHAIENYGWIGVDQRLAAHPPRLNMGALFCPIPTPETRLHLAERTAQVAGAVIEISSLLMKQAKQEMRESRPSVVVTSSLDSLHWTGVPSSTEIKAEGESWQNRALSRLLNLASPPTLWTATDVEPKALS
jgi:diguanylate cyclase (GGDEF)-like protein